jgi:REP element-mobilizing transposase RayT
MTGPPVILDQRDAEAMIAQYQETARIRDWYLHAASVMHNHTHVVVSAQDDTGPQSILEALKSWATRALKKIRALPPNGAFWTAKGSKRKPSDEIALRAGVIYVVRKQPNPLAVWHDPQWQEALDDYDRSLRAASR